VSTQLLTFPSLVPAVAAFVIAGLAVLMVLVPKKATTSLAWAASILAVRTTR
jgi:hypothetical protein